MAAYQTETPMTDPVETGRMRHEAALRDSLLGHDSTLADRHARLTAQRDQFAEELREVEVAREAIRRAVEFIDATRGDATVAAPGPWPAGR